MPSPLSITEQMEEEEVVAAGEKTQWILPQVQWRLLIVLT